MGDHVIFFKTEKEQNDYCIEQAEHEYEKCMHEYMHYRTYMCWEKCENISKFLNCLRENRSNVLAVCDRIKSLLGAKLYTNILNLMFRNDTYWMTKNLIGVPDSEVVSHIRSMVTTLICEYEEELDDTVYDIAKEKEIELLDLMKNQN